MFTAMGLAASLAMTPAGASSTQEAAQAVKQQDGAESYSEAGTAAVQRGDVVEAARLYRLAADEGDAKGQLGLGLAYHFGQGVLQNYAEAVRWYRLAAEQGNSQAQYNLGRMYHRGLSVPQNYVQAYKWFNLAAAQGDALAVTNRDQVAALMTPAQIAEGQRLAAEWRPS